MKTVVPVYLESQADLVHAQALFDDSVHASAATPERALAALRARLLAHLQTLASAPDQRALAAWLATPEFEYAVERVRVRHAGQQHSGEAMLVRYQALGRTLGFTPRWPQRHFELGDEAPGERLAEVFGAWLKERVAPPLARLLPGKCRGRIRTLELEWQPTGASRKDSTREAASLGAADEEFDGGTELGKVGQLLQSQERAIARETELANLAAGLAQAEARALVIVGEGGVGKSCLVHAWLALRSQQGGVPPRVWQIAPQRVISGMSFLGQWEARWLAILRHAASRDLILCFDDLLGLFSAGISSGSSLTMGDLLLPWIAARRLRVLAEITPEAWRVLRERQRAFADHFLAVHPAPPPAHATWRIVAQALREIEQQHQAQYALDAVPTALALAERHYAHRAFPGRIVEVLRALGARSAGRTLTRADVVAEFVRRTGSAASLIDLDQPLTRAEIESALQAQLKGQPRAVAALADVLLRAKTGLNDPQRPLATMLLLGPTGVGKTACAKALATFLGGPGALIRVDLNEYAEYGDAARLVGTFAQPDGLLTAAVRRQPCSVVLLDEIEKAAPDVHDVLLSLLDEGRLTDAHGRVAHFRQCVIVMTSNLGAREAGRSFGFAGDAHARADYLAAARRFFRPEFFNRIDHVLPFAPLGDAELRAITAQAIAAALARSGISTRHCLVDIEAEAVAHLMLGGRDPALGARAVKRGVERGLVQPLARALAAARFDAPTRVHLRIEAGALALDVSALEYAQARPPAPTPQPGTPAHAGRIESLRAALADVDARLDAHPGRGGVALDGIAPAQMHYAACREQQRVVQELLERASRPPSRGAAGRLPRVRDHLQQRVWSGTDKPLREARVDLELHEHCWLDEASAPVAPEWPALQRELAWLALLLDHPQQASEGLQLRALGSSQGEAGRFAHCLAAALAGLVGCSEARAEGSAVHARGFGLGRLLEGECGYWLRRDGGLGLIEVHGPRAATRIIRISQGSRHLDLRHGLEIDGLDDAGSLRRFILQGLVG